MRINQYVARATGLSRRGADSAIAERRVRLNDAVANLGTEVSDNDVVYLDAEPLQLGPALTIMLYKPVGYVCSRRQQGSTPTIYALLPPELRQLKSVGRLDRDSSGLLVLTNDGALAQRLQHPSSGKWKHYRVQLDRPLSAGDNAQLERGVALDDGISRLQIKRLAKGLEISLQEGRNRQIRRSFAALGYRVVGLHRVSMGELELGELKPGQWRALKPAELAI